MVSLPGQIHILILAVLELLGGDGDLRLQAGVFSNHLGLGGALRTGESLKVLSELLDHSIRALLLSSQGVQGNENLGVLLFTGFLQSLVVLNLGPQLGVQLLGLGLNVSDFLEFSLQVPQSLHLVLVVGVLAGELLNLGLEVGNGGELKLEGLDLGHVPLVLI